MQIVPTLLKMTTADLVYSVELCLPTKFRSSKPYSCRYWCWFFICCCAWFMFIGNEVLYDAEAMTGYKGVEDYATQNGVEENEIGSFWTIQIFTTESPVVPDSGAL